MEDEQLYFNFKRLVSYPEWKIFEKHVLERIQEHKEFSVGYLAKDKTVDAQRQAWICEGMLEAIEEPLSVIHFEENIVQKIANKFCQFCGNALLSLSKIKI